MIRFALILLMSLALSSQAVAAVKWNNSTDDGKAVNYRKGDGLPTEIPESVRPNDATISLYEEGRRRFFNRLKNQGNMHTIKPKGNAEKFKSAENPKSKILNRQFKEGFMLSYLFYDNGIIKYNGVPESGRFDKDITDETLFFTHSTGKSIVSYIVGHAICEGYISSKSEKIDWPLMSKTLYQGQPLINLLNMSAGDKHTIDENRSHYVMGSKRHHRDMDLVTISKLLEGTQRKGDRLFYNNFLADVIANYIAYRSGEKYESLLNSVFQDKIKIENEVHFELHRVTSTYGNEFFRDLQTRASYSFLITRKDLLRVAVAMMRDYQQQTCVGKYLKEMQIQAKNWPKYRPNKNRAELYLHNYAKKYGGQFYFDFQKMKGRNILATEGYNGQNMMIDFDNSRIVVTQSAATGWNQKIFVLSVIQTGKLPK